MAAARLSLHKTNSLKLKTQKSFRHSIRNDKNCLILEMHEGSKTLKGMRGRIHNHTFASNLEKLAKTERIYSQKVVELADLYETLKSCKDHSLDTVWIRQAGDNQSVSFSRMYSIDSNSNSFFELLNSKLKDSGRIFFEVFGDASAGSRVAYLTSQRCPRAFVFSGSSTINNLNTGFRINDDGNLRVDGGIFYRSEGETRVYRSGRFLGRTPNQNTYPIALKSKTA